MGKGELRIEDSKILDIDKGNVTGYSKGVKVSVLPYRTSINIFTFLLSLLHNEFISASGNCIPLISMPMLFYGCQLVSFSCRL